MDVMTLVFILAFSSIVVWLRRREYRRSASADEARHLSGVGIASQFAKLVAVAFGVALLFFLLLAVAIIWP